MQIKIHGMLCLLCIGTIIPEVLHVVHTESVFVGSGSGKAVAIYARGQTLIHPEPFHFAQQDQALELSRQGSLALGG